MCIVCNKPDDFDFEHMERELRQMQQAEIFKAATRIKDSIRSYQIWFDSGHISGYEQKSIGDTLEYLKKAQFLLSRYM